LLPPSSNDGSPIFGGKKNLEDFRVELGLGDIQGGKVPQRIFKNIKA